MKNIIKTIKKLEDKLLSDSKSDDINPISGNYSPEQHPNKILSIKQIKHDISVIARIFINGYCGWPFHSTLVKYNILNALSKIYDNTSEISVEHFFDLLKPIISKIPDNHISLRFGPDAARTKMSHKNKNVRKNIASYSEKVKLEIRDDMVILGIRTLLNLSDEHSKKIKNLENILPKSKCLIVDLRGNGGGDSQPVGWLADYLYGAPTRGPLLKTFIRTTIEAKKLQSISQNSGWNTSYQTKDPIIWKDYTNIPHQKFASKNPGYTKPIYILTDGHTGSSAEIFILLMMKHPYVKYIGDNSEGSNVFGEIVHALIPNSNIIFCVGNVYRELEIKNFELQGYTPNIKCDDDQDALNIAVLDYNTKINSNHLLSNFNKTL